jgi:hypothetical protein
MFVLFGFRSMLWWIVLHPPPGVEIGREEDVSRPDSEVSIAPDPFAIPQEPLHGAFRR